MTRTRSLLVASAVVIAAACAPADARSIPDTDPPAPAGGTTVTVVDTTLPTLLTASGVAAPVREATLSTRLMSAVTAVLVLEGELVKAGQVLVRLDARDLAAKQEQVTANVSAADAMHAQAEAHAARIRALFADSAAPKAMLEQAEAQLAQAAAARRAARAAGAELDAVGAYAEIRAPFAGVVTRRFVDPGAFAAPGAPLVTVQDASTLRVTVHVTPDAVRGLRAGQALAVTIEGQRAEATIEGVVPAGGSLHAVNAIVKNADRRFLAGSSAEVAITTGTHRALAVPAGAIEREGDLTAVRVRTASGDVRRFVRLGAPTGALVEVTAGLRVGETVLVRGPAAASTDAAPAARER